MVSIETTQTHFIIVKKCQKVRSEKSTWATAYLAPYYMILHSRFSKVPQHTILLYHTTRYQLRAARYQWFDFQNHFFTSAAKGHTPP